MKYCTCNTTCLCGTYDIESFYQKILKEAGPYADCVEAKETWWEFNELLGAELADIISEQTDDLSKDIFPTIGW